MMKEEVALVRKSEMLELLGIGDWTLRQWLERQGFPAPVYVTDGAPARWRLAQVRRWIDGRERKRRRVIRRGCLRRGGE